MEAGGESIADDLKVFGAPEHIIAEARKDSTIRVLASNQEAFNLFNMCSTQWHMGFDGATGLDYAGVRAVAKMLGAKMTPRLFRRLRILEDEMLCIIKERRGGVTPPT